MLRNLPIRRKLTLVIALTSTAALLLVSGAMLAYDLAQFRRSLVRELFTEAEILAENSAAALAFLDASAADDVLAALNAQPAVVHACLFSPGGRVFAEYKTDDGEQLPLLQSNPGYRFEEGYLLVFKEVKFGDEVVGTIGLRSDLREQYVRIKASASIAAVAFLAALLVSLILSIKFQRVISVPLLELAVVAQRVTAGKNYRLRANKRGNDEISLLMENFNRMLDQIEKRDAELRASEERFRQLAENISEVFWITDSERKHLMYVSPAYETIWGRPCASVYESTGSWLDGIHPEDRQRVVQAVTKQTTGEYDEIYRVLRPDGELRWVHDRGFPVRDEHGKIYRIAGIAEDITRRKRIEGELQQAEANYRSIFENAIEGIFQTTSSGRFLTANPAMARILGYDTPEELIATVTSVGDLCVCPRSRGELQQRLLADNELQDFTNQLYRKDGSTILARLNIRIVRDEGGEILYYEGSGADITAQRRAEQQSAVFAAAASRLSVATTPKEAASCIMDTASELLGWDSGFVHLYDPQRDRITPILTFDTIDGQRTLVSDKEFKEPSNVTRLIVKESALLVNEPDRAKLPVSFSPFGDTSRRSASMMYVLIRQSADVLGILSVQSYSPNNYHQEDLKLLQALAEHCSGALQRIQITEELRKAEAKYRGIFEDATVGIFQSTPQGVYHSANPALARMFGYESPEQLVSSVTDIEKQTYVLPEKRREFTRLCQTQASVQGFEVERYRKDGSKFWISVNGRAVRDGNGLVVFYEGTILDITSRRHLEKQLIEIADREQSRIGQDLHDGLCQHLVRTAFSVNLLEKDLPSELEAQRDQVKKLSRLIDEAITQSRNLARGLYPVKLEVEGLHSAIEELAINIKATYNLDCAYEWDSILAIDHAQATHLYRIAQEAIINAVKHAGPTQILIRLNASGGKAQLTVSDNGKGISESSHPNAMGLHIMSYRAGMIGASLRIEPRRQGGTIVSCIFEYHAGLEKALPHDNN